MSDEIPDPRTLINNMVANAADLPACESCDAETYLIPTNEGTYIHGVAHDADCPWLAERKRAEDPPYVERKHFSVEDLARVEHERNNPNDEA